MNCGHARGLFGSYWDDELTQAEREWLEGHFVSCSGCRRDYDELARTLELVADLPRAEVTPGFAEKVLTRARRHSPVADRMPASAPRWIAVTASAALLAVMGAMVLQWTGMPLAPRQPAVATLEQPTLLVGPEDSRSAESTPAIGNEDWMAGGVSSADTLFDHAEDVEFILDSVTLRKGRAHTVVRVPTEPARGEQAVITF